MKTKLPPPPLVEHHLFVVRIIEDTTRKQFFATITRDAIKVNETGYCATKAEAIKAVILP